MKVRVTKATAHNWYKVGEEYDICENTLHRDGKDYHLLVSDSKIGIVKDHFEVIDEPPKSELTFPFKVRCIDDYNAEEELCVGKVYEVLNNYGESNYTLKNVKSCWHMSRFEVVKEAVQEQPVRNKYMREIKPGVWVDVYDVLRAWEVADPCLQHLLKKALQPGKRHHKDLGEDLKDILASAKRAVEMYEEWNK